MAILPLVLVPDPILREKAQPVETVTDEIKQLLDDMLDTMYDAPGIGLAANQIGSLHRLFVMDIADHKGGEEPKPYKIINPEIIAQSDEISVYAEGCLSIPDGTADVKRPATVTLRYMNEQGDTKELDADGLLATCIQHELDHLDGILFTDHVSKIKRDMLIKRAKKIAKEREEA